MRDACAGAAARRPATSAQPSDSATWTGSAASSSTAGRRSRGSQQRARGERRLERARARQERVKVEGAPLTTAATAPATSPSSRVLRVGIERTLGTIAGLCATRYDCAPTSGAWRQVCAHQARLARRRDHVLRLSEDGRVRRTYQRGHGVLLRVDEPLSQHSQRVARHARQRRVARARGHRPRRARPDRRRRHRLLVDDGLRRPDAQAHHARQGARPLDVRDLGRDPSDHPARGRDPRRRRRDLHGGGRVRLRGAAPAADRGARPDERQELLVQVARRRDQEEPLPAADVDGR